MIQLGPYYIILYEDMNALCTQYLVLPVTLAYEIKKLVLHVQTGYICVYHKRRMTFPALCCAVTQLRLNYARSLSHVLMLSYSLAFSQIRACQYRDSP